MKRFATFLSLSSGFLAAAVTLTLAAEALASPVSRAELRSKFEAEPVSATIKEWSWRDSDL